MPSTKKKKNEEKKKKVKGAKKDDDDAGPSNEQIVAAFIPQHCTSMCALNDPSKPTNRIFLACPSGNQCKSKHEQHNRRKGLRMKAFSKTDIVSHLRYCLGEEVLLAEVNRILAMPGEMGRRIANVNAIMKDINSTLHPVEGLLHGDPSSETIIAALYEGEDPFNSTGLQEKKQLYFVSCPKGEACISNHSHNGDKGLFFSYRDTKTLSMHAVKCLGREDSLQRVHQVESRLSSYEEQLRKTLDRGRRATKAANKAATKAAASADAAASAANQVTANLDTQKKRARNVVLAETMMEWASLYKHPVLLGFALLECLYAMGNLPIGGNLLQSQLTETMMTDFVVCTGISGCVTHQDGRTYLSSSTDFVIDVDDIGKRNGWLINNKNTFDGSGVRRRKAYQLKLWAALLVCPQTMNHISDMLTLACDTKTHLLEVVAHGCGNGNSNQSGGECSCDRLDHLSLTSSLSNFEDEGILRMISMCESSTEMTQMIRCALRSTRRSLLLPKVNSVNESYNISRLAPYLHEAATAKNMKELAAAIAPVCPPLCAIEKLPLSSKQKEELKEPLSVHPKVAELRDELKKVEASCSNKQLDSLIEKATIASHISNEIAMVRNNLVGKCIIKSVCLFIDTRI